jgi:hypothetical protein
LAVVETLQAGTLNCRNAREHVLATVLRLDETVSFRCVSRCPWPFGVCLR